MDYSDYIDIIGITRPINFASILLNQTLNFMASKIHVNGLQGTLLETVVLIWKKYNNLVLIIKEHTVSIKLFIYYLRVILDQRLNFTSDVCRLQN